MKTEKKITDRKCRKCGAVIWECYKPLNCKRMTHYHFCKWDQCSGCGALFMDEKNKVLPGKPCDCRIDGGVGMANTLMSGSGDEHDALVAKINQSKAVSKKMKLSARICRKCGGKLLQTFHKTVNKSRLSRAWHYHGHLRCMKCGTIYLDETLQCYDKTPDHQFDQSGKCLSSVNAVKEDRPITAMLKKMVIDKKSKSAEKPQPNRLNAYAAYRLRNQ